MSHGAASRSVLPARALVGAAMVVLASFPAELDARSFFELANQRFQDGGRSGVRTDSTYQFNGPVFRFDEPDVLGSKSGLVDRVADGPTLWGRVVGGYDSNVAGTLAEDGSWFGGVQLGASENFAVGPRNVFLGGSARLMRYDGDIFRTGRDGNDACVFDLDLRLGLHREFSPSVVLTTFHDLNIGGYQRLGEPYLLPGVNPQDDILWRSASQLAYRFDRAPVNDPGLLFTTALRGQMIKGLDHDDRDVQRGELRQSLDYIVRSDFAAGVEGRFGYNTWDAWEDLDSFSYQLLATAGGRLANGIYYHGVAGWEWWTYDEDQFFDDRAGFYAELKVSGEVTDQFYVAGGVTYGINTVRPDLFVDSADPNGLRAAVTGVWDNDLYVISLLATYTWHEADLTPAANGRWERWSAGASVDRDLGSGTRVGVAVEYAAIDTRQDDFEDVETTVRVVKDF